MSKNRKPDADPRSDTGYGDNVTTLMADGELHTTALMQPGLYRMTADGPETVEIVSGRCRVKLAQTQEWSEYGAGEHFHVPAAMHYEIEVAEALDYVVRYPQQTGD